MTQLKQHFRKSDDHFAGKIKPQNKMRPQFAKPSKRDKLINFLCIALLVTMFYFLIMYIDYYDKELSRKEIEKRNYEQRVKDGTFFGIIK